MQIKKKLHGSDDQGMESKKGNKKTEEKTGKMPGFLTRFSFHA